MKPLRLRFLPLAGALAALVLALGGCVEFVAQTLSFRYDAAADALLIYQRYDGVFGGQNPAALDESELRQLRSVVDGERTFFFANWILELGVANLRETAAKPPAGEAPAAGAEADAECAAKELAALLAERLRVSSGPFFRDSTGRLCAVQRVRIERFSEVLKRASALLRAAAASAAVTPGPDSAQRALFAKLADPAAGFFVAGSGQLGFRVPECSAELAAYRASLLGADATDFAEMEAAFAEMGGRRVDADGTTVWLLGEPGNAVTTVQHAVSKKPYAPNAEAYAQARFGIAGAFDPDADRAEFFGQEPARP